MVELHKYINVHATVNARGCSLSVTCQVDGLIQGES